MKQYTSRFLKSVSLCYMAFPAVYLVIAALLFDIPGRACVSVLLSPFYYLLSLLAMAVGYGFWEMRRWAWHLFVAANILIVYANAVLVADHGTTHHKWIAFVFSFFALCALSVRVTREVRVPYFLPRIRWWESNPRYRLSIPVKVSAKTQDSMGFETALDGEILDLSTRGCFIKIRHEYRMDSPVRLNFSSYGLSFEFEGAVVWRPQSTVTHPKGLGVKFGAMPRAQKRNLRAVEQRLRKIASFYRSHRYLMNPEEFSDRMRELSTLRISTPKVRGS